MTVFGVQIAKKSSIVENALIYGVWRAKSIHCLISNDIPENHSLSQNLVVLTMHDILKAMKRCSLCASARKANVSSVDTVGLNFTLNVPRGAQQRHFDEHGNLNELDDIFNY
jgi:hypothetical protein